MEEVLRKREIYQELRELDCLELSAKPEALIECLNCRHDSHAFDFCREYLWRIITSILKHSEDNLNFICLMAKTSHFEHSEFITRLLMLPRKNVKLSDVFHVVNNYGFQFYDILPLLFEHLNESQKSDCIKNEFFASEKFKLRKKELLEINRSCFEDPKNSLIKIFKALDIASYLLDNQGFFNFLLKRIDLLSNNDTFFATRFAMTLQLISCDPNVTTRSDDANVIKAIVKNLDNQLSDCKPIRDYEILNLMTDLVRILVNFELLNPEWHSNILSKLEKLSVKIDGKLIYDQSTIDTKEKFKRFVKFFKNPRIYERCPQENPPRVYIISSSKVENFLRKNSKISLGKRMNAMDNESDLIRRWRKLLQLEHSVGSHHHMELHRKMLQYCIEINNKDNNKLSIFFELLGESRCLLVLRSWVKECDNFEKYRIIAKLINLQNIELSENSQKVMDIAVLFLAKLYELDMEKMNEIRDILTPLETTVLKTAIDQFIREETRKKYWIELRTPKFLDILQKWIVFLDKKQFVKCLLSKIGMMSGKHDCQVAYDMALAQCGYDCQDDNQLDPAESEENAEIFRAIYDNLKRNFVQSRVEKINIELAVQIFKNFVKINHDSWFIMDTHGVQEISKTFIKKHLARANDIHSVNLRDKIEDLFETNREYCSHPSFGVKYEVVSHTKVNRFRECTNNGQYFTYQKQEDAHSESLQDL